MGVIGFVVKETIRDNERKKRQAAALQQAAAARARAARARAYPGTTALAAVRQREQAARAELEARGIACWPSREPAPRNRGATATMILLWAGMIILLWIIGAGVRALDHLHAGTWEGIGIGFSGGLLVLVIALVVLLKVRKGRETKA